MQASASLKKGLKLCCLYCHTCAVQSTCDEHHKSTKMKLTDWPAQTVRWDGTIQ